MIQFQELHINASRLAHAAFITVLTSIWQFLYLKFLSSGSLSSGIMFSSKRSRFDWSSAVGYFSKRLFALGVHVICSSSVLCYLRQRPLLSASYRSEEARHLYLCSHVWPIGYYFPLRTLNCRSLWHWRLNRGRKRRINIVLTLKNSLSAKWC